MNLSTTEFVRFPHHSENVPEELTDSGERWVLCDEQKEPVIAIRSGKVFAASSTNPATWRPYPVALEAWTMNEHFTGVGRVIGADEDLVGVDLDDCLDPETGELTEHAARIAKRLATYTEISPSRRGFKLWLRAPDVVRSYKKPGLEIYSSRRYFTITGLLLPGAPWTVEERQEALQDIIAEEFPRVDRVRTGYYDGPARRIDLLGLLERASIEIFQEAYDETAEVKFDVLCPWYEEHTTGTSGTACGQYENGALFFRCYHSHCEHRTWHDFRRYAEALAYLGRPPRRERGRVR